MRIRKGSFYPWYRNGLVFKAPFGLGVSLNFLAYIVGVRNRFEVGYLSRGSKKCTGMQYLEKAAASVVEAASIGKKKKVYC